MVTKVCNTCGKEVELDKFGIDKSRKDGFKNRCKNCDKKYREEHKQSIKAYQDKYRMNNIEKEKVRHKKYRDENKEKIKEYNKNFYWENKEKEKQRKLAYRIAHPEKVKEIRKNEYERNKGRKLEREKQRYKENIVKERARSRNYRESNPEKIREIHKKFKEKDLESFLVIRAGYAQRRRARKRQLSATLTVEQWESAKKYFNERCAYCGRKLNLTQDHFIPVTKGGAYTVENILPACVSCNSSKHNNDFLYWYSTYKYYSKEREQKILEYLSKQKASAEK